MTWKTNYCEKYSQFIKLVNNVINIINNWCDEVN